MLFLPPATQSGTAQKLYPKWYNSGTLLFNSTKYVNCEIKKEALGYASIVEAQTQEQCNNSWDSYLYETNFWLPIYPRTQKKISASCIQQLHTHFLKKPSILIQQANSSLHAVDLSL